jgi:GNAT superfamily N-acetyltransferase
MEETAKSFEFKEADERDIELVMPLAKELYDYHHGLDSAINSGDQGEARLRADLSEALASDNCFLLLALVENNVVGYSLATIDEAKQGEFYRDRFGKFCHVFVEKQYRRMGLSRDMFERLLKWFEDEGVKHITLAVHVRNDIGMDFWRRLGFTEDLSVMRLDL